TKAQAKSKQTLHHEGREEHEVKKFKNINFPILRVLRALRGEIWFSQSRFRRVKFLLAKDFAEFFLVLVIIFAALRRYREEIEMFCLHLGIDAGPGGCPADRQDELLTFF